MSGIDNRGKVFRVAKGRKRPFILGSRPCCSTQHGLDQGIGPNVQWETRSALVHTRLDVSQPPQLITAVLPRPPRLLAPAVRFLHTQQGSSSLQPRVGGSGMAGTQFARGPKRGSPIVVAIGVVVGCVIAGE